MQHTLLMSVLQRYADVWHHFQRLLWGKAARLHGLAQIDPIDILHQQVAKAATLTEIIDSYDARMIQSSQHAAFTPETLRETQRGC